MDSSTDDSCPPVWAKELATKINNVINKHVYLFAKHVDNLGVDEEIKEMWSNQLEEWLTDCCSDINQGLIKKQETVMKEIETLLQQLEILHKKLRRNMPAYGADPKGLYEELKFLKEEMLKVEKEVEEKEKQLSLLKEREKLLCESLGKKQKHNAECPLPDLDYFQKYIEDLESEKFQREEKFLSLKEEILILAAELNAKPLTDFEKKILTPNDSLFQVTNANMKMLEEYRNNMKAKLCEVQEEIETLKNDVEKIWQMLEIDLQYQQDFRKVLKGSSMNTREALIKEKKRCENIKMENIQRFVEKLRAELKVLWDKCRYTEEQREQFKYLNENLYTEDLLEIHEREVMKLNKILTQNCEIYSTLERHEKLWNKILELQDKSVAPDRLKNRGGQLLREEKERNKIVKQLPILEDKLRKLADEYKSKNNEDFCTWGQTIEEYIENTYDSVKENRKKVFKQQKVTPQKSPIKPSKLGLSVFKGGSTTNILTVPTPTSAKRRLITPNASAKKHCPNKELPFTVPKLRVNNKTLGSVRLSTEKMKAKYKRLSRSKKFKLPSQLNSSKETMSSKGSSPYEKFEKNITVDCRSTEHFDHSPLAEPLLKTPVKQVNKCTPSKSKSISKSPYNDKKLSAATSLKLMF